MAGRGGAVQQLRDRGWSWLLDTERLHETIGCAIVDTAHILVVDAIAKGDLTLARKAAETACKAAPYDDICRLDLVKVAAAEGHGKPPTRCSTTTSSTAPTTTCHPSTSRSGRPTWSARKVGATATVARPPDLAFGTPPRKFFQRLDGRSESGCDLRKRLLKPFARPSPVPETALGRAGFGAQAEDSRVHEPVAPTASRDSPVESAALQRHRQRTGSRDGGGTPGSRGIPVFPCVPGGKRPLTAHGFQDASADPDVINFWWRRAA